MSLFTEFPDIKVGGVPEEVKEKIRAVQRKQHELQAVMSEVGQDKVSSHVKSYVVESTLCMNMAFNMLTDMANLVKKQNKLLTEKDSEIKELKKKVNIFRKIKKTQKKFKKNKNYIADCPYCDMKKGQLTNAHNYMEHIRNKHWA